MACLYINATTPMHCYPFHHPVQGRKHPRFRLLAMETNGQVAGVDWRADDALMKIAWFEVGSHGPDSVQGNDPQSAQLSTCWSGERAM